MGSEVVVTVRVSTAQNGYIVQEELGPGMISRIWVCGSMQELRDKVLEEALKTMLHDDPMPEKDANVAAPPTRAPWITMTTTDLTGTAMPPRYAGTTGNVAGYYGSTAVDHMLVGDSRIVYDAAGALMTIVRTS